MEAMDLVQARTPKDVKITATNILDTLGLNMSTYINMSLKQLIIQGGIPFEVKVNPQVYSVQEILGEVDATLRMEGMPLTHEDLEILKAIKAGKLSTDEARQRFLEK